MFPKFLNALLYFCILGAGAKGINYQSAKLQTLNFISAKLPYSRIYIVSEVINALPGTIITQNLFRILLVISVSKSYSVSNFFQSNLKKRNNW